MKRLFIMLCLMFCLAMNSCFNRSKIQEQSVQEEETVMEDTICMVEADTLCISTEEADTLHMDELMLCLIMSSYFNGSKIQEQTVQEEETVMEDTICMVEADTLCISTEEADTLHMDEQVTE